MFDEFIQKGRFNVYARDEQKLKSKVGVLCCAMSKWMAKTSKKELEQFFGPFEKSNTKTKPPCKR